MILYIWNAQQVQIYRDQKIVGGQRDSTVSGALVLHRFYPQNPVFSKPARRIHEYRAKSNPRILPVVAQKQNKQKMKEG